jgi:hypothetical protein
MNLDDVISSFGGEYGFIITLDDEKKISIPIGQEPIEFPTPALAIVAKVKNDVVFNHIDKELKKNPGLIIVDKGDLKMRTMTLPIPLPIEVRPTLARTGDYMILASSDSLVQELAAVKGGKKGFKSTEQFKRLSKGVPMEGNSFVYVSDTISKTIHEIQQKAIAMSGKVDPAQAAAMQKMFASASPSMGFAVSANGDEGWIAVGNGTHSLNGAVVAPALIAPIGLLAGIAVPNFVRARETSQMNAIINNLRMLDGAKQQWALENKKGGSDEPTMADLEPYLGRATMKPIIGEKYIVNPVNASPQVEFTSKVRSYSAGSRASLDDLVAGQSSMSRTRKR